MDGEHTKIEGTVSLSETVPQQVKPERNSPFDNLRAFEVWLDGLPLANVIAVSNELVAGLQELNRSMVAPKQRMKMLDRLLEPINTECALLDKEYQDTTFPLKEQVDRHGRVSVQLFRELAIGYRIATDEFAGHSTKVGVLARGNAGHAIAYALFSHEQYLLRLALLYHEVPVGVWSEIHTLYAFARQNKLQDKSAANPFVSAADKSSIEDVYRRLCLLGISDMCGLGQRTIRRVFDAAPVWATRLNLVFGVPRAGLFEIPMNADQPPQLIIDVAKSSAGLMLDVSRLREWLQPLIDSAAGRAVDIPFKRPTAAPVVLDNFMLRQVTTAWGSRVSRSFKRMAADHEIKMIVGINGIHYMVAGEIGLNQFIDDLDDVSFFASASSNQNWIAAADDRFRPVEYRAKVINQSVGGYRLSLSEFNGMNLRVGEIVSVCASSIANRDTTWLLGLVRWIHALSTTEMEVGVVIAGHAVRAAAVLLPQEEGGRVVPPFRGLIMDGFSVGAENTEHLLVPGFVSQAGAVVQLAYRGENEQIISRELVLNSFEDRTTEVSRFSFVDHDSSDDVG